MVNTFVPDLCVPCGAAGRAMTRYATTVAEDRARGRELKPRPPMRGSPPRTGRPFPRLPPRPRMRRARRR
ncbi:hypothetical protein SAMN05414137_113161 [Streptacidiphilus jiangxiensis]|uniref:Uncharacterized protein n=1 Tax=Streptacidiphilus jiangxiensis TaxID=235985 RepID=A0A1H7T9V7_STRJI|nr:hypothetical protein SAMN05414137_113161 [Streptacidiphilus jiangxiensis]